MVVYPEVQILDVTGPLEVFARTARWLVDHRRRGAPAYTVELLAACPGIVRSSSGIELVVRRSFMEVGVASIRCSSPEVLAHAVRRVIAR